MNDDRSPEACGIPYCKRDHEPATPLCSGHRRRYIQHIGGGANLAPDCDAPENSLMHAQVRLNAELGQHVAAIDYSRMQLARTSPSEAGAPVNLGRLDVLRRIDDSTREWHRNWREKLNLSVVAWPGVAGSCAFFRSWMERMEVADPFAFAVMADEFAELVSNAHSLSPWRAKVERQGAPCPECHEVRVVRYGGEDWLSCQGCGQTYGEGDWTAYSAMMTQEGRAA